MDRSAIEQFTQAMKIIAGLEPDEAIVADGVLHRIHDKQDRAGKKDLWYILFEDGIPAGSFGHWSRLPDGQNWQAKPDNTLTTLECHHIRERREQAQAAREQALLEVRVVCRTKTEKMLETAHDVNADHAYLVKKNIKPYGAKQLKDMLLIPVRKGKALTGLQIIMPDGSKKFLTGTEKVGAYLAIKGTGKTVYLVEGWATGCTIHELTGATVIVCYDCGNLGTVAREIRTKGPDYDMVLVADNDRLTDGNPGLTKARAAALATGARLAIPTFPGDDGTDVNDLAEISGREAAKSCLDAAALVAPLPSPDAGLIPCPAIECTDGLLTAVVNRLTNLSPLQYDQVRKAEAEAIGVRPATLDACVKTSKKADPNEAPFEEVEPWNKPVNGAELLDDLTQTVRRFIICEPHTAQAAALWIAMTWFIDVIQVAPLAVITAPEKRCGKSLLLTLIGRLVPKPIQASSISPSALFRSIDAWQPTLLIDEVDACMKDNEELRGLINCGHTRDSAFTVRCVGDDHTPKKFNVWGAKALSGIGRVADTVEDRSIILELRRKLPTESIDRIRYAEPNLFTNLSRKLARFAADNNEQVSQARPDLPPSLNDRAQDNWEPLLAIAKVAGGDWFKIATASALMLSGSESRTLTIGTELLNDIQEVFERNQIDRISSVDLIKELCADDEKPWATYNKGFQIKPRQIAARLKEYSIHSKTVRIGLGETPKGYDANQFREAFSRYIPATPLVSATTPQVPIGAGLRVSDTEINPQQADSKRHTDTGCVGYKSNVADGETLSATLKPAVGGTCGVVADKTPLSPSEILDLTRTSFEVTT